MSTEPPEPRPQQRRSIVLFSIPPAAALLLFAVLPVLSFATTVNARVLPVEIPSYWAQTLILLLTAIILNGIFVAANTAIELLRPSQIRSYQDRDFQRLNDIVQNRSRYVAACTLGTQTMVGLIMALCFVPAPAFAHWFSELQGSVDTWAMVFLAGLFITIPVAAINIIFGILVPKSIAAQYPIKVALISYRFIRLFNVIFSPVIPAFTVLANLVALRFGVQASFILPRQAEEEIKNLASSAEETGEIDLEDRVLLHSVFEFGDTVAREVMTPRVDLDAASIESSLEELMELVHTSGHSRIPIYENSDDQILGIVHAKDLLAAKFDQSHPFNLRSLMREPFFVPENKNLHSLLQEMRLQKTQMAIVQDEFGGTAGVVTIEDIVEELVGDIVDEYDNEENMIIPNGSGWIVEGKVNLYDLNEVAGSNFQSEEFDTIGGYVFGLFGRQPKVGEELRDGLYNFLIEETDGRRIIKLHVAPVEPETILNDYGE